MQFYVSSNSREINLTVPNFSTLELNKQKIYDFPVDKLFTTPHKFSQFNGLTLKAEAGKSRWWNILLAPEANKKKLNWE